MNNTTLWTSVQITLKVSKPQSSLMATKIIWLIDYCYSFCTQVRSIFHIWLYLGTLSFYWAASFIHWLLPSFIYSLYIGTILLLLSFSNQLSPSFIYSLCIVTTCHLLSFIQFLNSNFIYSYSLKHLFISVTIYHIQSMSQDYFSFYSVFSSFHHHLSYTVYTSGTFSFYWASSSSYHHRPYTVYV